MTQPAESEDRGRPVDPSALKPRVRAALDVVREQLLAARTPQGHWTGWLSSSSLSTATAISAAAALLQASQVSDPSERTSDQPSVDSERAARLGRLIRAGMVYLRGQQNVDGGFGDTARSHSNIATSYLVKAASTLAGQTANDGLDRLAMQNLDRYIDLAGGIAGLRRRYGTDKTFVVPILTNLAIAGLAAWKQVPALPFEAAALPQPMYRLARMPVVSYAIPALVAIGQVKHHRSPSMFLPLRWLRHCLVGRTLRVLRRMQPPSGGYLEATPLTSFVVMSLACGGQANHEVCRRGLHFLEASMRPDGSWPIDTNLATWVTSLSIAALSADPKDDGQWNQDELPDWLLSCQHRERHPYTGADPGGWGWSNLSGAVPDADDTPAAILALESLRRQNSQRATAQRPSPPIDRRAPVDRRAPIDQRASVDQRPPLDQRINDAIAMGQRWLVGLQNRDGGIPTFCRGWGKLPFDRSSTDLTAHAIRAWSVSHSDQAGGDDDDHLDATRRAAVKFLIDRQQSDGCWLPLWFGNQDRRHEDNPVYGTSKVLLAVSDKLCRSLPGDLQMVSAAGNAVRYLVDHQNSDGGWGGGPSVGPAYAQHVRSLLTGGSDADAGSGRAPDTPGQTSGEVPGSCEVPGWREVPGSCQQARVSTVEETALAVEALIHTLTELGRSKGISVAADQAIIRGTEFLIQAVRDGLVDVPWPIGFYFAKLWYHERLYPLIYTTGALGLFLRNADRLVSPKSSETPH